MGQEDAGQCGEHVLPLWALLQVRPPFHILTTQDQSSCEYGIGMSCHAGLLLVCLLRR